MRVVCRSKCCRVRSVHLIGLVQAFVLANVAAALEAFDSGSRKLKARLKATTSALRFYDVPPVLQERVIDSVEYYWAQQSGAVDAEVAPLLPDRCGLEPACSSPCLHLVSVCFGDAGCPDGRRLSLGGAWALSRQCVYPMLQRQGDRKLRRAASLAEGSLRARGRIAIVAKGAMVRRYSGHLAHC